MVLKEQELLQIDEDFINNLLKKDPSALAGLSIKLSNDLKEALERLNQNPDNSSRPSGSFAPWDKALSNDSDENELPTDEEVISPDKKDKEENIQKNSKHSPKNTQKKGTRKPGRQLGSQGFGRTQKLQVTDIDNRAPLM